MSDVRKSVDGASVARPRFAGATAPDFYGGLFRRLGHVLGVSDVMAGTGRGASADQANARGQFKSMEIAGRSQIRQALAACRYAFLGLGLFSAVSNILMLTGSFFMLQVYDRVLPSRSVPTLIGLGIAATILYVFQGAIDLVRNRMNVRIGVFLDQTLSQQVYSAVVRLPLKTRGDGDGLQPIRDLDQVRSFLSGAGPSAFFDLPWMILYLGICFLFHFWIGVTALAGAVVLIILALLTELRTRDHTKQAAKYAMARNAFAVAGRRNAEAMAAMGMGARVGALWADANHDYMEANKRASDAVGGLGGIAKVFRMILQSAVLGVGAYLVIYQQSTGGIIIASSILTARALAPVELAIANWKGFANARQASERLHQLLTLLPERQERMALPAPRSSFSVESIYVMPPGDHKLVVSDVSFELHSGQSLGIIGPNGSGKSSLARALVGVWLPARGQVRLDGAALDNWNNESLGRHIGYLPQDIELFDGSVAQNISRFEREPDAQMVIEVAKAAGVHQLVNSLPNGYNTRVGEGGALLSAGQCQRIGLARALYGNPFLVVLDEPNSNLDADGEESLARAVQSVCARGGIAIVIAHRAAAISNVDQLMVIQEGRIQSMGKRDEILGTVTRSRTPVVQPLKVVSDSQESA